MKKKYLLIVSIAVLTSTFFYSCEKIIDAPQADFNASGISSSGNITISFTDISSGSPDEWFWTFEGGTPSTSTEKNPLVTYPESGTYDVTLVVTNEGGDDVITGYDYINVVQFNNPLFTDIYVTIGSETKSMAPDSYVQFVQINDNNFTYYADTYGETIGGTIIGEEIFWEETLSIANYSSYDLILGSDFIFLYINNSSNDVYYPIYVNWGTDYQTEDEVTIPSDQTIYQLGYYFAFNNMEVRAYLNNSLTEYDGWYVYPAWTDNQYALLDYSKSTQGNSKRLSSEKSINNELLHPKSMLKNRIERDPNAKKLFPSNKK
ncbi:MAG: PKD domain-containing protein [Bacteroidales bacterium]|nr:PKD domain-containing protein [Bacteroidales bacterium]